MTYSDKLGRFYKGFLKLKDKFFLCSNCDYKKLVPDPKDKPNPPIVFLGNQPHDYYCIVSTKSTRETVQLPEPVANGKTRFMKFPPRIYSSKELALHACQGDEEPLYLICLICFLGILRSRLRIGMSIFNDHFECSLFPGRIDCQTTALLILGDVRYLVEGSKDTGVFWRKVNDPIVASHPLPFCARFHHCLGFGCQLTFKLDDGPLATCYTQELDSSEVEEDFYIELPE